MPNTQFDVWDGNSMPRGLAPKTNLWARNLRSSAENSPRQSLPPPLEHMKWPMAQAAEKARAASSGSKVRNAVLVYGKAQWQQSEEAAHLRTHVRYWHKMLKLKLLRPRQPIPDSVLADAALLAEQRLWRMAEPRFACWQAASRRGASHRSLAALVDLYLPHVMKRRASAAFAAWRGSTAMSCCLAGLAYALAEASSARRVLTALRDAGLVRALFDRADSYHHHRRPSLALTRRGAFALWFRWGERASFAFDIANLGELAAASAGKRTAFGRWKMQPAACARELNSCASTQRLAFAFGALRRRHAIDTRTLDTRARGAKEARRAALRRWWCGCRASDGAAASFGVRRLARIYTVRMRPQRRLARPCECIADVLREARV